MSAEIEIQRGLYTALTGIGLTVVDFGRQSADGESTGPFPYVEIGMIVLRAWDTAPETGHEFVARLHTWSRSGSVMETKDIQGQMWARLHRGTITVTGHNFINLQRETSDVMRAQSGAFHGVCEYRGLIETA
jgi:hypothetical protein